MTRHVLGVTAKLIVAVAADQCIVAAAGILRHLPCIAQQKVERYRLVTASQNVVAAAGLARNLPSIAVEFAEAAGTVRRQRVVAASAARQRIAAERAVDATRVGIAEN